MSLRFSAGILGRHGNAVANIIQTAEVMTGGRMALGAVDELTAVDLLRHALAGVGKGNGGAARQVAQGRGADNLADDFSINDDVEALGRLVKDSDVGDLVG